MVLRSVSKSFQIDTFRDMLSTLDSLQQPKSQWIVLASLQEEHKAKKEEEERRRWNQKSLNKGTKVIQKEPKMKPPKMIEKEAQRHELLGAILGPKIDKNR